VLWLLFTCVAVEKALANEHKNVIAIFLKPYFTTVNLCTESKPIQHSFAFLEKQSLQNCLTMPNPKKLMGKLFQS